jgi:hypothetical protein
MLNAVVTCCPFSLQAGPSTERDGLSKGQAAGVAVGCVLAGLLIGALCMMCWLKRRRLFPSK